MNGPPGEHKPWLEKADEDRLFIANELKAERQPWSVICFHAPQAVEKYLKAFLVCKGVRPERTHDLRALVIRCADFDAEFLALETDCSRLNSFAVDIRYPEIPLAAEEQTGRQAAVLAERICAANQARLPD